MIGGALLPRKVLLRHMERKAAAALDASHVVVYGVQRSVKFHAVDKAIVRSADVVYVGAGGHRDVVL